MVTKLSALSGESLLLPHRVWKVKFVGESVDDCGGGYSESIAEMCDELMSGSVPILIPTPNGRDEAGTSRDCYLLNPSPMSNLHKKMFNFLGMLMGIAIRTGSPLSINLAEPMWKLLAGMSLSVADITEIDRDYLTGQMSLVFFSFPTNLSSGSYLVFFVVGLTYVRDLEENEKTGDFLDYPFTTTSAAGHQVALSSHHKKITLDNRKEYYKLAIKYRLSEFSDCVAETRKGMSGVIPVPLLSLFRYICSFPTLTSYLFSRKYACFIGLVFRGCELETMVCGSPEIPVSLLKSVATYKGVEPSAPIIQWFWQVMEEFSNEERSLFLRFVWGRTRLPRTIADFRGRDFVLQVQPCSSYSLNFYQCDQCETCFLCSDNRQAFSSRSLLARELHLFFSAQDPQIFF